jgi:LCP family protein required for cell wall assembly
MKMSRRTKNRLPGQILVSVLFVVMVAFLVLLLYTKLLPMKYLGIIIGVMMLLWLIVLLLVNKFRHKIRFWIGVCLEIIILVVLAVGSVYIYQTVHALDSITGVNTEVAEVNVYVKTEDAAESINAITDYQFSILKDLDRENTDSAIEQLELELGTDLEVTEYDNLTDLAKGLRNGKVGAMILNSGYLDVIDEMDGYTDFSSEIKLITTRKVETVVEKDDPVQAVLTPYVSQDTSDTKADLDQVYTIYISGIDSRSGLTAKSRCDVNIVATVNPNTKQILLINTPRDYYVPLSISNGVPDKLTHAGIYGVNVAMETLEMLYGIDINYYFRLNFSGFTNIIDALGGITINSDYTFDSKNVTGYHFDAGENYVTGEAALAFCRERYAFSEGDRQRGRNQMAVIQCVVNKAMSTEILKNYLSVLTELKGSFETNVSYNLIADLVKKQLNEGGSWQVLSYSVDGTGATKKPYSMSQNAYVMVPDTATVEKATSLMQKVQNGEILTDADVN